MTALAPALAWMLLTAAAIVAAGTILARSSDVIAARTNLGGMWVGSVFLALATSLPEITTDLAALRIGAPDLAAGDLFGSSMANMAILALLALLPSGVGLLRKVALEQALYAAVAIVLTSIAAVALVVRSEVTFLGVSPGSVVLLLAYLAGSSAIFRHTVLARAATATTELAARALVGEGAGVAPPSLRRAVLTFLGGAAAILLAAPRFAHSAAQVAEITGVGSTFVGTWLVGFATSLPELVTSLAAVRMGAFDLAVGNLFGSNAFNMSILALLDIADGAGSFLARVSPTHAISALTAMGLMAIAIAGLVYRVERRPARVEMTSALILLGYVAGLALVLAAS